MKNYWCECLHCTYVWVAQFAVEMGCLFAADDLGEQCPECGSGDIETSDEYTKGSEL